MKKILVINGSLSGSAGNTAKLLDLATELLSKRCMVEKHCLANSTGMSRTSLLMSIDQCCGMLLGTGVYWDSHSSLVQDFLENTITELEGTSSLMGKPVGFVITEMTCGGKSVLNHLQGVFSSLGALIPPQSGMVYSMTSQIALEHDPKQDDVWQLSDLEILTSNLIEACEGTNNWKAWGVDRSHVRDMWVKLPAKKDPIST
jgi:NAD(P)H-dependent FMN reductase